MSVEDNKSRNANSPIELDRLIHEPARLLIFSYLYVVECADFIFLERQTGLTRGNLSSHLSKLVEAGYVEMTKEFVEKIPHTVLKLTDSGRLAFQTYRQNIKQMLDKLPE